MSANNLLDEVRGLLATEGDVEGKLVEWLLEHDIQMPASEFIAVFGELYRNEYPGRDTAPVNDSFKKYLAEEVVKGYHDEIDPYTHFDKWAGLVKTLLPYFANSPNDVVSPTQLVAALVDFIEAPNDHDDADLRDKLDTMMDMPNWSAEDYKEAITLLYVHGVKGKAEKELEKFLDEELLDTSGKFDKQMKKLFKKQWMKLAAMLLECRRTAYVREFGLSDESDESDEGSESD